MKKTRSRPLLLLATGIVAALLAGCASGPTTPGHSSSASSGHGAVACIPPVPSALPKDPDGVLKSIKGAGLTALGGYPGSVYASPWADFTPASKAPWTIGYSGNSANPTNVLLLAGIQQVVDAHPNLFKSQVISVTANPANDAASQIQGMRTLLRQGVDIILSPLSSPEALNGVIDDAAAQGVPVISLVGQSTSKNAVNLEPNPGLVGYYGAAGVIQNMGPKGSVVMVRGLTGLSIDVNIYNAAKAVFDACPGIKIAGELTGFFDPAIAKTEMLKYFTTHPGAVNGAFTTSNMAFGVISAFTETGRPVPPVSDVGPNGAALAYWRDHPDYPGTAVGRPAQATGRYAMAIATAMLQGRGLKVNEVPFAPIVVTSANLKDWVLPSYNATSNIYADGPADAIPADSLVDSYFSRK